MLDVAAYLKRIDYHGPIAPTAETLRALHRAHLLAVPFENLDIHWRRPIIIDEAAFFEKIVRRRRGGFCYEVNGLFAALLRALDFDVTLLSAGVADEDGGFSPEFDHLTLLVSLDERWLADVGFGDSFREPLRLNEPDGQAQDGHVYRIHNDGAHCTLLRHCDDGAWENRYRFTLQPRRLTDFADMCHYHQTSPASIFTQKRVCTRATPSGRITLSDLRLILTEGGGRQERLLSGPEEYAAMLHKYFGIDGAE